MQAIPWYKSPVYIGIIVNLVYGGLNLLGMADIFSLEQVGEGVAFGFGAIAFVAAIVAEIKRRKSPVQPLTLTKTAAIQKNIGQGGFARVGMLALLASMGTIAACGSLGERFNPVHVAAETGKPELVLLALDGSYTIVQGQALAYAQQPNVPQAVKNCIAGLAETSDPIIDELRPAAREVERLRGELLAAGDDQERAAVVLANLNKAITDAYGLSERVSPQITALTNAVKGECS